MQSCDLLIRNAYLITVDAERRVFRSGAVAIKGNTIVAVGQDADIAAQYRSTRVFDAKGAPVHPGMIDPHLHMSIHLSRTGLPDDPARSNPAVFTKWFNVLTDEDEYANSLVACVEMARNGFTACMEPGTMFETDTAAAAAEAVGVRVCLGDSFLWDVTDAGNSMASQLQRAPASTSRALDLLGRELRRNRDPNGLVRGAAIIYGSGSASEELTLAAKRCATDNDVVFNQHQSFAPKQVPLDDARFGKHVLVRFAELGLLDRRTSFTHMNGVRDDEIDPVARSGMSIIWMPGNYQYYSIAAGQKSRMVELLTKGANLTVCVDAAKIWTFGEMARIAYLVARQAEEYISTETLLEMQTIRAAQAMGLEHMIGSIEVGKRADVVIRRDDIAEALPNLHPIMQLIMLSRGAQGVDTVICNGEVIVRSGQLTRVDEEAAYALGRASTARMVERLDLAPWSTWPVQ